MKKKLNMFQRTMLRWRDLHPYSAVHVVRVAAMLDTARLKASIERQLEALGLTHFELDRSFGRYEWRGGYQAVELAVLSGDDPWTCVDDEIARQLNAPFARDGRGDPFRFFAVDCGEAFLLGLAYDHFVAGGDSVVRLLCAIVGRYVGASGQPPTIDATAAPSYRRLFIRQIGPFLRGLGSLRAIAEGCRRSFRPVYSAIDDGRNAFVRFRLGPGELAAMRRAAQEWGVTQNDLFMALLLLALSPLAVRRRGESVRRELGVASIVNIRRDFGSQAKRVFAPLLASFRLSESVPEGIGIQELAQSVHRESDNIRSNKLYLQTLLGLGMAAIQWRFFSDGQRKSFFAKHYAVWAGTTPLNAGSLWVGAGGADPPPEYARGVSTGPLSPMVCAISTAGEIANVGISYRTAAFDGETVDRVAANMLARIKSLPS